jgi:hypothetical protein
MGCVASTPDTDCECEEYKEYKRRGSSVAKRDGVIRSPTPEEYECESELYKHTDEKEIEGGWFIKVILIFLNKT